MEIVYSQNREPSPIWLPIFVRVHKIVTQISICNALELWNAIMFIIIKRKYL